MAQESFAGSVPGFYVVSFSYQRKCQLGKLGPVRKAAQDKKSNWYWDYTEFNFNGKNCMCSEMQARCINTCVLDKYMKTNCLISSRSKCGLLMKKTGISFLS